MQIFALEEINPVALDIIGCVRILYCIHVVGMTRYTEMNEYRKRTVLNIILSVLLPDVAGIGTADIYVLAFAVLDHSIAGLSAFKNIVLKLLPDFIVAVAALGNSYTACIALFSGKCPVCHVAGTVIVDECSA